MRTILRAALLGLFLLQLLLPQPAMAGYPSSGPGTATDYTVNGAISASCSSSTGCPNNSYVGSQTNNSGVAVISASGTFSAVCLAEASGNGSSFTQLAMVSPDSSSPGAASFSAPGVWRVNVAGFKYIQVRCSAYTSGTVLVSMHLSPASAGGSSDASGYSNVSVKNWPAAQVVSQPSGASLHADIDNLIGPGINDNGSGQFLTICDKSVPLNVATTGSTQLVAGVSGKQIHVCGVDFISNGSVVASFNQGSGSACGTGTALIAGPYALTAQTGLSRGAGIADIWQPLIASNSLCISLSASVQIGGVLHYTIF